MRYKSISAMFAVICWMLCSLGPAIGDIEIDIFLLNTEFFFDHKEPHGEVVGKAVPVPTAEQYEAKAKTVAELIDTHKANIVGLVGVENRAVLEKVKYYLASPDDWQIAFDEGRDTYTGQDVALLTKFRVVRGSATNFPNEREIYFVDGQERDVNPSKILGVELRIDNQPFYVLVTHLVSRRGSNDPKRLAQATVVRRQAVKGLMADKNVIVMGDINDTPGTPVINRLRGFDDIWDDFLQTANVVEADNRYTYIHEGQKNLLDHILISPSLLNEFRNVEEEKRGFDDIWDDFLQTANVVEADNRYTYIHEGQKNLLDHILISPSLLNEFRNVEEEKQCEIIDVGGLSDHRAILARLRIVHPVVVLETNKGTVEMELYPDVAPKTVANFVKLIEKEFYDGLTFHRYVENFVIQGGDPEGSG